MKTEDLRVYFCILAALESGRHLYIWGGDDTDEGGFDCSGFVYKALETVNRILPRRVFTHGRVPARMLLDWYEERDAGSTGWQDGGRPDAVEALDLDSDESGFPRYPIPKLEHQLVNIRHLQHHAAQLADRLRNQAGVGVEWVGWHRTGG